MCGDGGTRPRGGPRQTWMKMDRSYLEGIGLVHGGILWVIILIAWMRKIVGDMC